MSSYSSSDGDYYTDGTTSSSVQLEERFVRCGFCEAIMDINELTTTEFEGLQVVAGKSKVHSFGANEMMQPKLLSCFKLVSETTNLSCQEAYRILLRRWYSINRNRAANRQYFNCDELFLINYLVENGLTRTAEQYIIQAELLRESKRFADCLLAINNLKSNFPGESDNFEVVLSIIECAAENKIHDVLKLSEVNSETTTCENYSNSDIPSRGWLSINEALIEKNRALNKLL